MSEVNVDSMDRAALEQTANDLGLKFAANIGDDTLRDKLREALGEPPKPKASSKEEADSKKNKRFEIIVATHERDKQPVPVGVNGRMYLIQRGKKVIVPASVIGVLETAVRYEYDPADMKRTEVLAYPFQIIREVTE